MERFNRIIALSAVLVGTVVGTSAQAQVLSGNVVLRDSGVREYPLGTFETGRFARFMMDDRLSDLNLRNRDFEAWKPLDVGTKYKMRHFMHGRLNSQFDSPVVDQEIGRYQRFITDDRLLRNNIELSNRDFEGYQISSPYTAQASSAVSKQYLHGLPVGTNLRPLGNLGVRIGGGPRLLNMWQ